MIRRQSEPSNNAKPVLRQPYHAALDFGLGERVLFHRL